MLLNTETFAELCASTTNASGDQGCNPPMGFRATSDIAGDLPRAIAYVAVYCKSCNFYESSSSRRFECSLVAFR